MNKLDQFLEWFHDGREEEYEKILKVFGSTRRFLQTALRNKVELYNIDIAYIPSIEFEKDKELFDFLAENGFLDDVEYNNLDDTIKNYYLQWFLNKDATEALNFICSDLLTDVEPRGDDYWLHLRDREELADYFRSSSRRSDYDLQQIAKQVLVDGGLDYGWYDDTTDDVYRDVIEVLNEQNLHHLANYILENIGNKDLSTDDFGSEFFIEMADTDGLFQITSDNVMFLIENERAMDELLDTDLSDLKSELYSVHNTAYNRSYEDMIYNQVMYGLDEYFSSPIDEVAKQVGEKTRYTYYIKIRDFYSNVLAFIENNLGGGWNESVLEYFGSYTGMMNQLFSEEVYEPIDFRVDDYPDYRKVDSQINELFGDYIY